MKLFSVVGGNGSRRNGGRGIFYKSLSHSQRGQNQSGHEKKVRVTGQVREGTSRDSSTQCRGSVPVISYRDRTRKPVMKKKTVQKNRLKTVDRDRFTTREVNQGN